MFEFPKGVGQENLEYFRENPLDHIRLVVTIAKESRDGGLEFENLVMYGILGLLKACRRFDRSRGNKFSTYATYWIRQEINRAFRNVEPFIQVPEYLYSRKKQDERGELSKSTESQKCLEAARRIWKASFLGIPQHDSGEENIACGEVFIPECPDSDVTEQIDDYDFLRKALTGLGVREQRILIMFFFKGMSVSQIMEVTGLSKSAVHQTKSRALRKLRKRLGAVEV